MHLSKGNGKIIGTVRFVHGIFLIIIFYNYQLALRKIYYKYFGS